MRFPEIDLGRLGRRVRDPNINNGCKRKPYDRRAQSLSMTSTGAKGIDMDQCQASNNPAGVPMFTSHKPDNDDWQPNSARSLATDHFDYRSQYIPDAMPQIRCQHRHLADRRSQVMTR
jgi:hypothetical protein